MAPTCFELVSDFLQIILLPTPTFLAFIMLATLSHVCNPIIYGFINRSFRQTLIRWMRIYDQRPQKRVGNSGEAKNFEIQDKRNNKRPQSNSMSNQQGSSSIEVHVIYTVQRSRKSPPSDGQNKRLKWR